MVLVDTSVWVNHLRKGDPRLIGLLIGGKVATHEFIIGELACGNIKNRTTIINSVSDLYRLKKISLDELLIFIDRHALDKKGIGFVDVHLLASSKLSGIPIFTYDKKLAAAAKELAIHH